jgi:predicted RNase H-like nuclease
VHHRVVTQRSPLRIAGIDGCRAGWVIAHDEGWDVVATLAEVIGDLDVIGIDMPIGLPPSWGRVADTEARRFLRGRASTVFPTPPRSLVAHTDYAVANAVSKREHGRGLTKQTFFLFPKIAEVDALADPRQPDRLVEIHPECAFARMCGAPLPPKRTPAGGAARRDALERHLGTVPARRQGVDEHDVLDAHAVLWSARRFAAGAAVAFGGEHDARGLPMRIVS